MKSARLLGATKAPLTVQPGSSGFTIVVPQERPDPVASVIVLETADAR